MIAGERTNPGNLKTACLFMLFSLLALAFVAPVSAAEQGNATNVSPFFVTMDPVGEHVIGDTFFINGTTNVPSGNNTISLEISPGTFNPSGFGYYFSSTVPIKPGEQGVNTWSCEVLVSGWQYFPNSTGFIDRNVTPGNYYVSAVYPDPPENAFVGETFVLLPTPNVTQPPVQTSVSPTSPQIQPPTQTSLATTRSSSFPTVLLPIAVIAAITITRSLNRRKR
jgi:hypothetical protein